MELGKSLIVIGLVITFLGLIVLYRDKLGPLAMLGNLPGDIKIERPGMSFYFPLTSCLLVSLLFSLIFWVFRRF